jgi:hypothetical protein
MRCLLSLLLLVLLAGCAETPLPPTTSNAPTADPSVLVADADAFVPLALTRYVDLTNAILSGSQDVDAMRTITTPEWNTEEQQGFAALDALGGDAPRVELTKWEIESRRGRRTLVDVLVAACLGSHESPTRVTVRLVPRSGNLVVAEIAPWEDSTWCAASPSL